MDCSLLPKKEIWGKMKRSKISETGEAMPTKLFCMHVTITPNWILFEPILFDSIFWPHVHGPKGNFGNFEGKQNLQNQGGHAHQTWCECKSHQPLLEFFLANSIRFYFLTPMDYSPWFKRESWPNLKRTNISKTREAMPTKLGLHVCHINPYLHEFFELVLCFDPYGL